MVGCVKTQGINTGMFHTASDKSPGRPGYEARRVVHVYIDTYNIIQMYMYF